MIKLSRDERPKTDVIYSNENSVLLQRGHMIPQIGRVTDKLLLADLDTEIARFSIRRKQSQQNGLLGVSMIVDGNKLTWNRVF